MKRLSLLIMASFVFAMGAFAAPAVQDQPEAFSASTGTAKTNSNTTATSFVAADRLVTQTEQRVELYGKSSYALSRCAPTFTPIANTIDRMQPLTQPPIY